MNIERPRIFVFIIVGIWIIAIGLMIKDYLTYPPLPTSNPLSDRIGNVEGSIYKYGVISFLELILGIVLMNNFFSLHRTLRLLILLSLPFLVFVAFVDAMYGGGVPSVHAIWAAVEVAFIYVCIFINSR